MPVSNKLVSERAGDIMEEEAPHRVLEHRAVLSLDDVGKEILVGLPPDPK